MSKNDDPGSGLGDRGKITSIDEAAIHQLLVGSGDGGTFYETSLDGTRLISAKFKEDGTSANETKDLTTIQLEDWSLNPRNNPSLEAQSSTNCALSATDLAIYSTPSLQKMADFSSPHFFERADPVAFSNDLQYLRIGSQVLSTGLPEPSTASDDLTASAKDLGPYWEEMACRGQYVVLCCRRTPRHLSKYHEKIGSMELEDIFLDDELDKVSSVDGSEIALSQSSKAEDAQSQTSIEFDDDASAAEGSLAFSDEDNLSNKSEIALSTTDRSSNASIFSDDEACKSEAGNPENPSFEGEEPGQLSDDELSYEGESSDSDNDSNNSCAAGYCDLCSKDIVFHYRCPECNKGNFDICNTCFKSGKWCFDTKHEMIRFDDWVQEGGESVYHDDLTLAQELVAFDHSSSQKTPIFRFHRKPETLMHKSPPVIHPFEPLIIWPLTQGQLLFANLVDSSSFVHNIRPSSTRTYTLSTTLHIPPSGHLLHLLSLETTTQEAQKRRKFLPPISPPPENTRKTPLSIRASTYRLPDSQKIKTPPTLVHSETCSIGSCSQLSVSRMLFSVTWTAAKAYVAFTDASTLKLYRFQLFPGPGVNPSTATANGEDHKRTSNEASVCVPRNKVLLPKSAEDRTVQFFPGDGGEQDRSVLVVHGRSGKEGGAPCVIYLDERDLGGWMDIGEV